MNWVRSTLCYDPGYAIHLGDTSLLRTVNQRSPKGRIAPALRHPQKVRANKDDAGVVCEATRPRTDRQVRTLTVFWSTLNLLLPVVSLFAVLLCEETAAAPAADLWPRWQKHNPKSREIIDHSAWQAFLKKYLRTDHPSGVNRVRYHAVISPDKELLDSYIRGLESLPISRYSRDEQRAFWINLYNALTVRTVLEHFPVASIKEIRISRGFFNNLFSSGPWKVELLRIEGENLSLDDIEHRILRPIWGDARVHYAVNCASIGCPDLLPDAFSGSNTARLLDEGARAYVNHPRGVSIRNGQLRLSKIYDWFEADFGDGIEDVLRHLRSYAQPDLRRRLENYTGSITYDYDWRLNGDNVVGGD